MDTYTAGKGAAATVYELADEVIIVRGTDRLRQIAFVDVREARLNRLEDMGVCELRSRWSLRNQFTMTVFTSFAPQ